MPDSFGFAGFVSLSLLCPWLAKWTLWQHYKIVTFQEAFLYPTALQHHCEKLYRHGIAPTRRAICVISGKFLETRSVLDKPPSSRSATATIYENRKR